MVLLHGNLKIKLQLGIPTFWVGENSNPMPIGEINDPFTINQAFSTTNTKSTILIFLPIQNATCYNLTQNWMITYTTTIK